MDWVEVEALLKQTMGMDAASIGSSSVERAVRARLTCCELADPRAYGELLRASAAEQQALIEAVVVSETWFFRDREAFGALAHCALQEWLPAHAVGNLRLLSLPCSTGEEPYSMAMALLDAGFPPDRYQIDAIDISEQVLVRARHGLYGSNAFRGADLDFQARYFERTSAGFLLKAEPRAQVQFHQANLLAEDFTPAAQRYDGIFCRNLLIYFDRATQDLAVQILRRRLCDAGVLFVGPSEAGLLLNHNFVSSKIRGAFAFRTSLAHHSAQSVTEPPRQPPAACSPPVRRLKLPTKHASPPVDGIAVALTLANRGQMVEAAKVCEAHLSEHGPSAPGLHLMGLIRAAAGSLAEAARFYRQALYLDPGHGDTLIHLALLLEKEGDVVAARRLRERALRRERGSTR